MFGLFAGDMIVTVIGIQLSSAFVGFRIHAFDHGANGTSGAFTGILPWIFVVVCGLAYYLFGLYKPDLVFDWKRTLVRASLTIFVLGAMAYLLLHVVSPESAIFGVAVWVSSLLFVLVLSWRFVFKKLLADRPYRICMVESDALCARSMDYLLSNGMSRFFRFTACSENDLSTDPSVQAFDSDDRCDMIVYPWSKRLCQESLIALIQKSFGATSVCDSLTFYKNCTASFPALEMDAQWLIGQSTSLLLTNSASKSVKRALDIVLSVIGIILSMPLMIMSAILIKLTSKGPILYEQIRVGLSGEEFPTHKFRTMIENAEQATGPIWAQKNDPRVTPIGRFLRKTRIDELPQLFDVLRGNMSLIGPRPIRKVFEDEFSRQTPFYSMRHLAKPGLTGWAQVNDMDPRAQDGPVRRLEYDLYYIFEYSLLLDAVIVVKTIQNIFQARGQ